MAGSRWVLATVAAVTAVVAIASATTTGESAPLLGRHLLQTRGMWVEFEKPSSSSGWSTVELLHEIASPAAQKPVGEQLNRMRAMGVNEILLEMRAADSFDGASGVA